MRILLHAAYPLSPDNHDPPPQMMDALYKAERKKSKFGSLFRPREKPVFTFRAGPLGAVGQIAPLLPYA
jgi:hypothetical protein